MAQRSSPAADTTKQAVSLARALTIALRSWAFYPPEHPAVALAVDRMIAACTEAANGGLLQLAVTPHALLIDGLPLETTDLSVIECAELLHDRDILQLTLVSPPPDSVVRSLLNVLSLDRETRRARGGPAVIWAAEDQTAFVLEQIDYQEILEREIDEGPARRDATWKSIVRSIIMGRKTFTAEEQARLVEISKDVGAIGELCKDTKEPYVTPEGSPMVTTQAATVLAVYRHIAKTVAALEPERVQEVIDSFALAAGNLEPTTALELLLQDEQQDEGGIPIVAALKQAFDDQQVALLLARAMSSPGHPTNRLAQVLDTLAPDEERKRRVLTLAKKLITERDFGGKRPIDDIRKSLDDLLLKYDESTYVSTDYRQSMDTAATRAGDLAARGLPPEMDEWLDTLGHESVRRLSGQLLIDLLRNETVSGRMADTARDMAAFIEELLLAGAYDECVPVLDELLAAIKRKPAIAPEACQKAVDGIGTSAALAEAASSMGDQSAAEFAAFEQVVRKIGPAAIKCIIASYQREDGLATERATQLLSKMGAAAVPHLIAGIDDGRWFVQREIGRVLGKLGGAAAVAPLQTLLRRGDPRVLQSAVSSLAVIDDPSATRALHTVLKAATGEARAAVISALTGMKDPRVVPMLTRIVQECDPFSDDYPLLHETLAALATLRDERAVQPIAALARRKRWLSLGRTMKLRDACLRTLQRIGTAKARAAITELAQTGDFFLKRQAAALGRETS
ncbi:MAG TPA: HEAT repeat domain-containing protein [Vicinamibacterales bacterium]|nr:HEAT repeat domain-containing protein [Vicinamibacterales bacterium]